VNDTVSRRHNSQVIKRLLAPLEELESLLVTVEFDLLILIFSISFARHIDLNGVVDNEIHLTKRVDF